MRVEEEDEDEDGGGGGACDLTIAVNHVNAGGCT